MKPYKPPKQLLINQARARKHAKTQVTLSSNILVEDPKTRHETTPAKPKHNDKDIWSN